MAFFDIVLLPLGSLICGIMAAANIVLGLFPLLRKFVYGILSYRIVIGLVTVFSGIMALLFPYRDIIFFGSFFPAVTGIMAGLMLSLEYFSDKNYFNKNTMVWIGNVLLYLKYPLGIAAIIFGIMHLFKSSTLFL